MYICIYVYIYNNVYLHPSYISIFKLVIVINLKSSISIKQWEYFPLVFDLIHKLCVNHIYIYIYDIVFDNFPLVKI